MLASEAVKKIMVEKGVTNVMLAALIDISGSAIYERLTQPNLTIYTLDQMLEGLGYEIVLRPRIESNKDMESYVIRRHCQ